MRSFQSLCWEGLPPGPGEYGPSQGWSFRTADGAGLLTRFNLFEWNSIALATSACA